LRQLPHSAWGGGSSPGSCLWLQLCLIHVHDNDLMRDAARNGRAV